jgi:hypothetical protein
MSGSGRLPEMRHGSRVDLVPAHRASCRHKIMSMILFGLDNKDGEVPRRSTVKAVSDRTTTPSARGRR